MARIDDKKRKQIIADYVGCGSYRQVARMHGVSATSVKSIVLADSETVQKCAQKKEQNTADILQHMDENTAQVKRLLSKMLKGMELKLDQLDMFTSVKDIATAYGIVVDKAFKTEEIRRAQKAENSQGTIEDLTPIVELLNIDTQRQDD